MSCQFGTLTTHRLKQSATGLMNKIIKFRSLFITKS